MAQRITREADAKTQLLPAGWTWDVTAYPPPSLRPSLDHHGKTWSWGRLVRNASNDVAVREAAYSALCTIILNYECDIKIQAWSRSGRFKDLLIVDIRPLPDRRQQEIAYTFGYNDFNDAVNLMWLRQNFGSAINLEGWADWDGVIIPAKTFMRDGQVLCCANCNRTYPNLVADPNNPTSRWCTSCVLLCPGTSDRGPCRAPVFDRGFSGCATCFPRVNCDSCTLLFDTRFAQNHNGATYCGDCIARICQRCGSIGGNSSEPVFDGSESYYVCTKCRPLVIKWVEQDKNERVVLEKPCNMLLESHSKRPVRLASVELELSSGANEVMADLYKKSLSNSTNIAPYHQGDTAAFCYMEQDSSLPRGGGELIFSRMSLDKPETTKKLSEALGVVRKHVKDGTATVDLRTGCHIHIDAHKMGLNHIRNLVLLFNYLEDPLYRISAANYTRHRGVHYAMVLPKSDLASQNSFNQAFFRKNGHHSVLNVGYYYQAIQRGCACGNIMAGAPDACECQLGKCTVEFRVFNGTSSWSKLHGYLALCMSLVAYAKSVEYLDSDDFPPCLYNPVGLITTELQDDWSKRLGWLYENLWFTESERTSINYCVEHSELQKLPYSERAKLRKLPYVGTSYTPSKPARKETTIPLPKAKTLNSYISNVSPGSITLSGLLDSSMSTPARPRASRTWR